MRAVSNENGDVVKEIVYDTFGNIISDSNETLKIPFGFAGGLQDKDTKLIHFGFREYDPFIGRWTAKDPILFAGGDSNLYGYVLSDPVSGVDALGLWSDTMQNIADRIAFGNRPDSKLFILIFNDIQASNRQMLKVYNGAIKIFSGLVRNIPKMWRKAHPSAKSCLVVASTIAVAPVATYVATKAYSWAMTNPGIVMNIIDMTIGIYDPNPPTNIMQVIGNRIEAWLIDPLFK